MGGSCYCSCCWQKNGASLRFNFFCTNVQDGMNINAICYTTYEQVLLQLLLVESDCFNFLVLYTMEVAECHLIAAEQKFD